MNVLKVNQTYEEAIIELYLKKKCPRQIRLCLGVGFGRIRKTIKFYESYGMIPDPRSPGRPSKATERTLQAIEALTIANRKQSSADLAHQLSENGIVLSTTSVWRYRHQLHFNFKPPKQRQALSQAQKENRLIFGHSILNSELDLERIVFSDESRFCIAADNSWIWYRRGELSDNVFKETEKYSQGIMMYGAIGLGYKSRLIICSSGVNAIEYHDIITRSGMFEVLDQRYGAGNYTFMQDGAPAHTAAATRLFLKKRCSYIAKWPANSPDLNPIEHLWGAIKRILKTMKINSKSELISAIYEIWNSFPQDAIDRLVLSFKARLYSIIDRNGESISDLLRSGIDHLISTVIPFRADTLKLSEIIETYDPMTNENIIDILSKRPFTVEEDIILLQKVQELGTRWTKISGFFTSRTPQSLKARFSRMRKKIF